MEYQKLKKTRASGVWSLESGGLIIFHFLLVQLLASIMCNNSLMILIRRDVLHNSVAFYVRVSKRCQHHGRGNMYDMFSDIAHSAASHLESAVGRNAGIHVQQPPSAGYDLNTPRVTAKGPPPAGREAIRKLNIVQVTSDDLIEESNKECLICLDEQKIGSTACKLACGHLYHQRCLTEWLLKSCTCEF